MFPGIKGEAEGTGEARLAPSRRSCIFQPPRLQVGQLRRFEGHSNAIIAGRDRLCTCSVARWDSIHRRARRPPVDDIIAAVRERGPSPDPVDAPALPERISTSASGRRLHSGAGVRELVGQHQELRCVTDCRPH
jgi:hypothetical protein